MLKLYTSSRYFDVVLRSRGAQLRTESYWEEEGQVKVQIKVAAQRGTTAFPRRTVTMDRACSTNGGGVHIEYW
jgi:hypothetical protein